MKYELCDDKKTSQSSKIELREVIIVIDCTLVLPLQSSNTLLTVQHW